MADRLRLMAVHAHPDDESSKGAATMAKYAGTGYDVLVVSCTGGERGDVLNPRLKGDPHIERDLAQVRREEMARAQEILGVTTPGWGSSTRASPRVTRCRRCPRAVSRSSRSRSPPRHWSARSAGSAPTS